MKGKSELEKGGSPERAPVRLARSWRHRCPGGLRVAIAVLLVGLAWTITFALRRTMDAPSFQTPFFFCAIVISSWVGGAGPGIVATLLSIFAIEFAFTEPRYTLGLTWSEVPKFTVFFLAGGFISWLAGRQRRDEEALLVARESLEEKVRERTSDLQAANANLTTEVDERIRAEKELQRLNRAWRVRSHFNRAIARSAGEHELLQRICQTMIKVGGYQLSWIAGIREGEVYPEAHATAMNAGAPESVWQAGRRSRLLASKAIQAGTAISCNRRDEGATGDDDHSETGPAKAVLALPLIAGGGVIGCLMVYSADWDVFDEKETDLLQQAANDVAQGIVLFRAREAKVLAEAALERTQSELERVARVTTMGELTASIAHEINQPLAAVVTNANACLRWLDRTPANLDEAREAARRIIRDGKRGSEVIARIRALLKREDAVRSPLAINDTVGDILALTHNEMEGIHLETVLDPGLPEVPADRVQVQQVLLNLILNAIDAMESSPDQTRRLTISTSQDNRGQVEVAVCDSGIGLPPERMEKIFDTFFTTKTNGLGMGLAICRSIIEQHGGRLWAENNDGRGATFRFSLPCEADK